MYRIYDKEAAINQVLEYLGMNKSGIYSEGARLAVIEHQSKNGLNTSGVVDYATFLSLRDTFRLQDARRGAGEVMLDDPIFPYRFGSVGRDVSIINAMLADVSDIFSTTTPKPEGSYFTKNSAGTVRELRKIFLLPGPDEVDEDFFIRLQKERDNKKRKY